MVPIIITVRKQSERCKDKILRPFYDSLNLLDICLEKLKGNKDVYVAGHEKIFKDYADKYNVNFIQRTKESAMSEDSLIIHSHLKGMFKTVCQLNACCPLIKKETIFDVIDTYKTLNVDSLFTVKKSHDLIFNSNKVVVNNDRIFNSKLRAPNYIGNNVMLIYPVDTFFNTGSYWSYSIDDPYLYIMSDIESIDIDTELDFKIAQKSYEDIV